MMCNKKRCFNRSTDRKGYEDYSLPNNRSVGYLFNSTPSLIDNLSTAPTARLIFPTASSLLSDINGDSGDS